MGSYTFKWEHPAEEVYVTGTFDNWTKSVQLEKNGDVFEKKVELENPSDKIYYKFVVDNNWVINESSPKEADPEGNVNNFLTKEQVTSGPIASILNTVAPGASTTAMAGEQPLEKDVKGTATPGDDIPGGFPATPANELDNNKTFSVNPLPAADGAVNPINLAPGEPVPELSTQSVNDHVKLDKESYENSGALAGVDMRVPEATGQTIPEAGLALGGNKPVTVNTVGPGSTTAALAGEVPKEPKAEGAVAAGPIETVAEPVVPASVEPVTKTAPVPAVVEEAHPSEPRTETVTAAIVDAKVPEVVKDSQAVAHADPEASTDPLEVAEKRQVEDELKEKVPEAPSTSEGIPELGTVKSEKDGAIVGAVASAGATVAAAAIAAANTISEKAAPVLDDANAKAANAYDTVATNSAPVVTDVATAAADSADKNLPEGVKEKLPVAAQEAMAAHHTPEPLEKVAPQVPVEVKESIAESAKAPEAAASSEAVLEKKAVENELLSAVTAAPAVGESSIKTHQEPERTQPELACEKKEEKKTEAAAVGNTKVNENEKKLEAASAQNETKAAEASSKVEAAADKEANADTTKEKLSAKAQKVEAEVQGKVAETKAAATGQAAEKVEKKQEEKKPEAAPTNPAPAGAASSDAGAAPRASTTETGTEASTEQKKKNRLSSMFSKLKSKLK